MSTHVLTDTNVMLGRSPRCLWLARAEESCSPRACMARVAGGRAASWATAVPSLMRSVTAARYARGDRASVP